MPCKLEPPPVERPGYSERRRLLQEDLAVAREMGDDYFKFMTATEMMLSNKQKDGEPSLDDLVIFAWDKNEGVWVLEDVSKERFKHLQILLGSDYLLWHEALEKCGAVYYSHWRVCPWSKAALELSVEDGSGSRPFFQIKSDLRSLEGFGVEDTKH